MNEQPSAAPPAELASASPAGQPAQRPRKIVLAELRERYPSLFGRRPCRPMKVGVFHEILADYQAAGETLVKQDLSRAVQRHVGTADYLRAVVAGGPRYGRDGQVDGEVSPKESAYARGQLTRLLAAPSDVGYQLRNQFLDDFEASGKSLQDYAAESMLDAEAAAKVHRMAVAEQEARRAARLALVREFQASGMSADDFALSRKMKVTTLERTIQKVALAGGEQSGEDLADGPAPPAPSA